MQLLIRSVQYHPNTDSVAALCENPLSSFYVNLKQSDLPSSWGDADVLTAVTAAVAANPVWAGIGFVVAFPPAEAAPATA